MIDKIKIRKAINNLSFHKSIIILKAPNTDWHKGLLHIPCAE